MRKLFTVNSIIRALFLSAAFLLCFIADFNKVYGQIVSYTTDTSGALFYSDPNIVASPLRRVNGATTPVFKCGSGFSATHFTSATSYAATLPAVQDTLVPDSGFIINITQFTLGLRRSNTGPGNVRLAYSVDGGTTWIDQGFDQFPKNSTCGDTITATWATSFTVGYPNSLIFSVFGFNASALGGTLQILDMTIDSIVSGCSIPFMTITPSGDTTFCAKDSVVLSVDTGYSYQWYDSGSVISGATNATYAAYNTGFYSVIVTASGGCIDTVAGINVTALPLPANVITASGSTSFCLYDSVTLNADTGTGYAYQWYKAGVLIGGATDVSYTAHLSADYTVAITDPAGCRDTSAPLLISVYSLPPAKITVTGGTTFCAGDSVILKVSSGVGITYQWFDSTTAITGATSSSYIVKSSGDYVAVVAHGGCTDTSIKTNILANSLPSNSLSASGDTTFCIGDSVTLTADTGTGYAFQWYNGTTMLAGATSISYTATVSGNYNVVVSALGCTDTSRSVIVTANTLPVIGPIAGLSDVCVLSSVGLTDTTSGGVWSSDSTSIATIDASGNVTGVSAGTSTITYTVTSGLGCTDSAVTLITVNALPVVASIAGAANVCLGDTAHLSDATSAGTWNSADTSIATINAASGIVTGISAGTTMITYVVTNSSGCTDSATTSLTVNALPVLSAITGITNVCQGSVSSAPLSDTATGGVWSSDSSAIAAISPAGFIAGVSPGTTTIVYTVTGGLGCTDSATILVTVDSLPPATIFASGPLSFCMGDSVILNANTGIGYTYQWYNGITAIPGATAFTYAATSSGDYSVTVFNSMGCSYTSTTLTVTVNALPLAIIIPAGPTTFCQFDSVVLNADFGAGYTYQWQQGSVDISDTTFTYTAYTSGSYDVVITDSNGCTNTSAPVIVTEVLLPPAPITASGPSLICSTDSVVLSTTGGYNYQWFNSGTAISGATDFTYTANTTGNYYVIVAGSAGCTDTSLSDSVTVLPVPVAVITVVGDTIICPGSSTILNATTGAGYTYQWYDGGTAISGATLASYVDSVTGLFTVTVFSPGGCSSTSPAVSVTVNPAIAIITPIGTTTFCIGGFVILNADTGTGFSYQWQLDSVDIAGAVSATYIASTGGNYTVVVTNSTACTAVSTPVTVTVNPLPTNIVSALGATTLCAGDSVVLSDTSDPSYIYQWSNGAGVIPGATNPTYTVIAVATDNYTVAIMNSFGCSDTSVAITITVNPLPVSTISPPGGSVICTGSSTVLNASTGAGYTYQWYEGTTAIAGATTSSYTTSTSGAYSVVITSSAGCTSTSAEDTVVVVPNPVILTDDPKFFCWGSSVLLYVSIGGISLSSISYQWEKDGTYISGATNASYSAYLGGVYLCIVTTPGVCGTITTNTITLVQYPLPNPIITFSGVTLSTQNYFTSYQWYEGGVKIPAATTLSITATSDGSYQVAVTDSNGCQSISDIYVLSELAVNNISNNSGEIKIYPNPANEKVYIESPVKVKAVISSMDGRIILTLEDAKEISLGNIPNGVYMLMLYDEAGLKVKVQKLVKSGD